MENREADEPEDVPMGQKTRHYPNGAPVLTKEAAEHFASLGRPEMMNFVGQVVGVNAHTYALFLEDRSEIGLELDIMLDIRTESCVPIEVFNQEVG